MVTYIGNLWLHMRCDDLVYLRLGSEIPSGDNHLGKDNTSPMRLEYASDLNERSTVPHDLAEDLKWTHSVLQIQLAPGHLPGLF